MLTSITGPVLNCNLIGPYITVKLEVKTVTTTYSHKENRAHQDKIHYAYNMKLKPGFHYPS